MNLEEAKKQIDDHLYNEMRLIKEITESNLTPEEKKALFKHIMQHPHINNAEKMDEIGPIVIKLKEKANE